MRNNYAFRPIGLSIVFAILTVSAWAQTAPTKKIGVQNKSAKEAKVEAPAVQTWTLDPTSFMGIELGKPLEEQKEKIIFCPQIKTSFMYDWDPNYKKSASPVVINFAPSETHPTWDFLTS